MVQGSSGVQHSTGNGVQVTAVLCCHCAVLRIHPAPMREKRPHVAPQPAQPRTMALLQSRAEEPQLQPGGDEAMGMRPS